MRKFLEGLRDFICPISVALLLIGILAGATITGALEVFMPGTGKAFAEASGAFLGSIPDNYYLLVASGLGVYIARRGYVQATKAKFEKPPLQLPDNFEENTQ